MLTRAYDAIMASLQVPMFISVNTDYNTSAIDDSVLNCKDYSGYVRTIQCPGYVSSSSWSNCNVPGASTPFACFYISYNLSYVIPDEDATEPAYEDYSGVNNAPAGWSLASSIYGFEKYYDETTKEIVCTVTIMWQNTSGSTKTVYGVKVMNVHSYRSSYASTSTNNGYFLVCREHFAAPIVVENNSIISLSFTWRVGRAGLVAATAASASA